MGQRGRKSEADLSVVSNEVEAQERPAPPAELTHEQRIKWQAVVNAYPADHFAGRAEQLKAYCRHAVEGDHIAQLIESETNSDGFDVSQYSSLVRLLRDNSSILNQLSVRLQIGHDTSRMPKPKRNRLQDWK